MGLFSKRRKYLNRIVELHRKNRELEERVKIQDRDIFGQGRTIRKLEDEKWEIGTQIDEQIERLSIENLALLDIKSDYYKLIAAIEINKADGR